MSIQERLRVPQSKKVRVVIDTDAACEADDPFAIVHALLSPKLEVRGILAEQFGTVRNQNSTAESYQEIQTILDAMGRTEPPVLMGAKAALSSDGGWEENEASRFLAQEALREDARPLLVLCQGALTNVAIALRMRPEIAARMTVVWIGGYAYGDFSLGREELREFNAGNDVRAANEVLFSGVDIWQIPMDVYTTMNVSLAELVQRVGGQGRIGRHLVEQLLRYNNTQWAFWTQGESWSLGDSPVVGLAMNPHCGRYIVRPALAILENTRYDPTREGPKIRVYTSIDSRFILEDLFAKLALFAQEEEQQ